ncbi:GNAT family N-acetyltransferase [Nocardia sp. GCM10030253]|uniref:GNAT family N-acetyltransferase n=1 Tax=Nocardia sp. GCM10030253 TaxID=3273404 RepID=UPI0036308C37
MMMSGESGVGVVVELVALGLQTLRALADGDAADAARVSGLPITGYLIEADHRRMWALRYEQVQADSAVAAWATGVVYDPLLGVCVGCAGYHGPADRRGMVEVGYAIDPVFRRRGYARAALVELLDRAAREPAVRVVRASVSPDNQPSLALIGQYGFVRVGNQFDLVDGLEFVYEVGAGTGRLR